MAFGPIMEMKIGKLVVRLAPLTEEVMGEFIDGGMQTHTVNRYMGRRAAPVLKDELEWFERTRTENSSLLWGIWIVEGDSVKLIGSSALHQIEGGHFKTAASGSMIFLPDYWGKGIASHTHRARTWYGFTQLGLTQIRSQVVVNNVASARALEKCGYLPCGMRRNFVFVDGEFRHEHDLECINPIDRFWKAWWGSDKPGKKYHEARQRSLEALAWSEAEVKLL